VDYLVGAAADIVFTQLNIGNTDTRAVGALIVGFTSVLWTNFRFMAKEYNKLKTDYLNSYLP